MKINYTIIIPHHNIPHLLERCLRSIPVREDIQVIVVDDCSDEMFLTQVKELEKKHPAVTFFYSSINGGAGKARNIGMSYARGKYLIFADADDFFNYCIDDILNEYINFSDDIVFFNASSIDSYSFLPSCRAKQLECLHNNYSKNKDNAELCFRFLFGEPWAKMIRHELITSHNILFEETIVHNDTLFSYMAGFYAKKIKVDNRAMYCITTRTGSVSSEATSTDIQFLRARIFSQKNKFFRDNQIKVFDEIMLWPFKKFIWDHDWANLSKCFAIAKQYGFSPLFVLKQIFVKKIAKKNNTNWVS